MNIGFFKSLEWTKKKKKKCHVGSFSTGWMKAKSSCQHCPETPTTPRTAHTCLRNPSRHRWPVLPTYELLISALVSATRFVSSFSAMFALEGVNAALEHGDVKALLKCLKLPHLNLKDVKDDNANFYLTRLREMREYKQVDKTDIQECVC